MTRKRDLIDLGMGVCCLLVGMAAFPVGLLIIWGVARGTAQPPWLFMLFAVATWAGGTLLMTAARALFRPRAGL